MKRIYYGNLTIDTSNDIAELAGAISVEAARAFHNGGHQAPGGFTTQSFPVGATEILTVHGFVGDATVATTVDLQVGSGIAFAVGSVDDGRPAPESEEIRAALLAQLAELRGEVEG